MSAMNLDQTAQQLIVHMYRMIKDSIPKNFSENLNLQFEIP